MEYILFRYSRNHLRLLHCISYLKLKKCKMQKRKEKKRKEKKRKKKKFIDYFSTLFEGTIGEEPSSYMGSIPEYSVKFTV